MDQLFEVLAVLKQRRNTGGRISHEERQEMLNKLKEVTVQVVLLQAKRPKAIAPGPVPVTDHLAVAMTMVNPDSGDLIDARVETAYIQLTTLAKRVS